MSVVADAAPAAGEPSLSIGVLTALHVRSPELSFFITEDEKPRCAPLAGNPLVGIGADAGAHNLTGARVDDPIAQRHLVAKSLSGPPSSL